MFWVFWRKKTQKMFFLAIWLWFSFKNNRLTNVLLVDIFKNALKIHYYPSKLPFLLFLVVNICFCNFENTNENNMCASIVFKAETKQKHEENFLKGFFFKNKKHTFEFGLLKSYWTFDYLTCSNRTNKKSLHPIGPLSNCAKIKLAMGLDT